MTNKEAIAILERLQEPEAWEPQISEDAYTALQMAIDALDNIKIPRNASWYPYYQQALTAVSKLPSVQPERLTNDDFETIRIHLSAFKEKLGNQGRWKEAEEYQRLIDRFMAFAQSDVPDRNVGDTISRQVALKEIEEWISALYENAHHESASDGKMILNAIKHLPSAQPEPCEDCVSRKAVIRLLHSGYHGTSMIDEAKKLPSVRPEPSTEIQEILDYLDTTLHPIVSPDNWNVYAELYDMISNLTSVHPNYDCVLKQFGDCTYDTTGCSDCVIKAKIKAALSAQPEQKWIPCSERLPEDTVIVTVETKTFKYKYVCEAVWIPRWSKKAEYDNWEDCSEYNEDEDEYYVLEGWYERVHNWDEYSFVGIEDDVIAWMPLPKVYGGEPE